MKDLKDILRFIKYDKKNFIMSITLIIVETLFELIIPFVMKDIINKGIKGESMGPILIYGLIIIGCALMSVITGHFYSIFNARFISNYSYMLRGELFKKIQTFSFANLDKFEASTLITRITNDVSVIQNTLSGSVRPIIRSIMMLVLGVGLSFILSPRLAWIFIVAIPLLALILILIIRNTAPKYKRLQEDIDQINLVVREDIVAIRTVKAYVREEHENAKFNQANNSVTKTTTSTFKVSTLNQPAFELTMYAVTVMILSFGAKLVHNEELLVGTLSALLSYVMQVVNSIMMLSNIFLLLNRSFASASRVNAVLKEEPTIKNEGKDFVDRGNIEFRNVYFKYKESSEELVLKNINLSIPSGTSLGIIGGTGSAKSTLVSLICRLYDVSKGEILIDSKNIKQYDLNNLRDSVSIVLQNNVLFSGTIRQNLLWGNKDASDDEIYNALKIAQAYEFVSSLGGLDYDLGQGGVNVSGGQRQRLCIARALLKNPKIIIFDDSTSACDMETERKILEGIRGLKDVTNIIIGQRVMSVCEADKIIILDDGEIVGEGNHQSLYYTSNIYKELCDTQLGGNYNGNNASS